MGKKIGGVFLDKVESILERCEDYRDNLRLLKRQVDTMEDTVNGYDEDIESLMKENLMCEKTSELFKKITDVRNKEAKEQIEDVLNYALSNIPLEQKYRATLEETESKRSGKELKIVLTDIETGFQRNLKDQTGTWVVQVISFILTMIVIKFSGSSRVMVLDEVFTGMEDHEMIKIFGDILVSLAENEDFQIFMVEHRKELDTIEGVQNIHLQIEEYEEGTKIMD